MITRELTYEAVISLIEQQDKKIERLEQQLKTCQDDYKELITADKIMDENKQIKELKKANESLVKALREAADDIEIDDYLNIGHADRYRAIADANEIK